MSNPRNVKSLITDGLEFALHHTRDMRIHVSTLRLSTVLGVAGFGAAVTTFLIEDYPVLSMVNFSFIFFFAFSFDWYYRRQYQKWDFHFKLLHGIYCRHLAIPHRRIANIIQLHSSGFDLSKLEITEDDYYWDFHSKTLTILLIFIWVIAATIIVVNPEFHKFVVYMKEIFRSWKETLQSYFS